ncbi:MAG: META domain-containing protein [Neisseriaceae bacterium]
MTKQVFIYSLPILFLSGCIFQAGEKQGRDAGSELTHYRWQLVGGTDQKQRPISELKNTELSISLEPNRISLSGGCNSQFSSVEISPSSFKTEQITTSLKLCPDYLMREDSLLAHFFNRQTIHYQVQKLGQGASLRLINGRQETLSFNSILNENELYGPNPIEVFIEIAPKKVAKEKLAAGTYHYRFINYIDPHQKLYGQWHLGLPKVQNYTQPAKNVREVIQVKQFSVKGGSNVYEFDKFVEQEALDSE